MIYFFLTIIIVFLILVILTLRFSLLIPLQKGLPILMYHNISTEKEDQLTISTEKLEKHFEYLKKNIYDQISFSELKKLSRENLHEIKPVILTFDDAYQNISELLVPLLNKFGFKATIFVPVNYIGKTNQWDENSEHILNKESLNELINNGIEIGLHGFDHINYRDLSLELIEKDIKNAVSGMNEAGLGYIPVLAYPYGGYPRKEPFQSKFKKILEANGIQLGLRIGNRINKFPFKAPYEIKRIDIRGNDSFFTFRTKLKKGREKLF